MDIGLTWHTLQSEAPWWKKALQIGIPQSKLILGLTVDDARYMYAMDAIVAFCKCRKGEGKELYNNYVLEETIAISNEDKDDYEIAKRLRLDPLSPSTFAGMVRVKPKVLAVEEANEPILKDEKQRIRWENVNAGKTFSEGKTCTIEGASS